MSELCLNLLRQTFYSLYHQQARIFATLRPLAGLTCIRNETFDAIEGKVLQPKFPIANTVLSDPIIWTKKKDLDIYGRT